MVGGEQKSGFGRFFVFGAVVVGPPVDVKPLPLLAPAARVKALHTGGGRTTSLSLLRQRK
jgi:hypothetical protein